MSSTSNTQMSEFSLKVSVCPSKSLVYENVVFVSAKDAIKLKYDSSKANHIFLNSKGLKSKGDFPLIHIFKPHKSVFEGELGMSRITRQALKANLTEDVQVKRFLPSESENLNLVYAELFLKSLGGPLTIDAEETKEKIMTKLSKDILSTGSIYIFDGNGLGYFSVIVDTMKVADPNDEGNDFAIVTNRGVLSKHTFLKLELESGHGSLNIVERETKKNKGINLFGPQWKYSDMGIGGLDEEFTKIFRRAFASRTLPSRVVKKLGIEHVRGLLLFGPPGTGKTLIARKIGKMLRGREPKIVNGPEILNKYVGQSEENIRALFSDAEKDFKKNGEDSDLHIIIFDEIDAICKQRGSASGGTGVHDTVVNQLLSKLDGIDSLNNILVIGMTNRKDMIDPALLRPGRFEVHVEIGLPDKKGREQILKIHTKSMRENGFLGSDVSLPEIALKAKNFSGAEIAGLVKNATSFAYYGSLDIREEKLSVSKVEQMKISSEHFQKALDEAQPAFGSNDETLELFTAQGILDYGESFHELRTACKAILKTVENRDQASLMTILLEGPNGAGKTALACHLAKECGFPFTKVLSPEDFVGWSESAKCSQIAREFENAYKSTESLLVLDNIERLLGYVDIGPRFSNAVLQTLFVLLKKLPPVDKKTSKTRKLCIIGTTSSIGILQEMGLHSAFMSVKKVPLVKPWAIETVFALKNVSVSPSDLSKIIDSMQNRSLGIKKLLTVIEMCVENGKITYEKFAKSAADFSAYA